MAFILLQQVSNSYAKRNAKRTLDKPIALRYFKKYFPESDYEKYTQKYADGTAFVWGAKYERGHQIEKMLPKSTLVLFRRANRIFRIGVISDLLINPELAERLWGLDVDGEAWGIVYFMEKVRNVSISAEEMNIVIGRKRTDHWQGMTGIVGKAAEDAISYVRSTLPSV